MLWSDKYETAMRIDALQKIVILVLIVLLFLNMDKCNNRQGQPIIAKTSDTLIITKTDTVWVRDTITHKLYVDKPVYVYVDSSDTDNLRAISVYNNVIDDSLLTGNIVTEVDGELINAEFTYIPKFPKYIYKTDSVIINNTETRIEKKNKLFLGAEVGGNMNSFELSPMVAFKTKSNTMLSYRYGLIEKTHNVGLMVALRNPLKSN